MKLSRSDHCVVILTDLPDQKPGFSTVINFNDLVCLKARHVKRVADKARVGLHLLNGLGIKPWHGTGRQKAIDPVITREVGFPDVLEMYGTVRRRE